MKNKSPKKSKQDQDFSTQSDTKEYIISVNRKYDPMRKPCGILVPDWWEEWEKIKDDTSIF